mmetsp:Transcript_41580/g.120395  ORF Transcript_41580/g.120395 Transcript_41580/m.120395 type:complete len:915 (+) Transcript_41580:61-2805(+)
MASVRAQRADSTLGAALTQAIASNTKGIPLDNFPALEKGLLSLLNELRTVYSKAEFQAEVKDIHSAAGGDNLKLITSLAPVATRVQDPIFQRFGLPPGSRGVLLMKTAAKVAAQRSPKIKQLSGDLRELLGLTREEVPQPLFPATSGGKDGKEESWQSKAARYKTTVREQLKRMQHGKPSGDGGQAVNDTHVEGKPGQWEPLGTRTFFPDANAIVTDKTPMGRPPDIFDDDPTIDRSFASPAMALTDRYEMNIWLSRSLTSFNSDLGREASSRLFDGGARRRTPGRLRIIYIAGVEGTGHHGFGPLLMYPAVCEYGDGTLAWWRSLREVLMKTPPPARRAKLRKLMAAMREDDRPQTLFEWASWPFGEEGRERWAAGCDDHGALDREVQSGNPGNSVDLSEFVELFREHGDVRVLVLHRGLTAAAWSHQAWDKGPAQHARVLALFNEYLTQALQALDPAMWRWVSYERVCEAHHQGEFAALDPIADFLGLEVPALRRSFRHFRPSKKDAAAEMPPEALSAIRQVEQQRSGGWFPSLFPEQQLMPGSQPGEAAALQVPSQSLHSPGSDTKAANQKLAMLLDTMNKEQMKAWQAANARKDDPAAISKLKDLLSEDQKFLLGQASIADKLTESLDRASMDPGQHTCLHMWIEGRGFGSELNNLISAAVFCEEHGLDCVVEDDNWNSGRLQDYLDTGLIIHRTCPWGDNCRPLEIRRNKQIATPGWFGLCKHALSVPFETKSECARRLWRYTGGAGSAIGELNAELELPRCYLAVQIRRGDKVHGQAREALALPLSAYAEQALALYEAPCTGIAVCSDDAEAAGDFAAEVRRASPRVAVYWRQDRQAPEALCNGHLQREWNALPLEQRSALTHEFLADLEVMRGAHVLLCTCSSNVGRLAALLRKGRTHSLDEAWTNA